MQAPLILEPDPEDPDCATLFVEGEVAGHPCRFVLDSGAARSAVVSREGMADLARSRAGTSTGVFGAEQSTVMVLPTLRVGSITAHGLEVSVVPEPVKFSV